MMNKKLVFLLLSLLFIAEAQAQRSLGVELGTVNALSYTSKLSRHWAFSARLGLELDDPTMLREGLSPTLSIEPMYTLSSRPESRYYQRGAYVGLHLFGRLPQLDPIGVKYSDEYLYTNAYLSLGFAPTFGWVLPLGERSYLRASLGLGFLWAQYRHTSGEAYWDSSAGRNTLPLLLQAVYSFRF